MAKELGLQALTVPESLGGMGYGLSELALVMEELGRALYNGPFFSTICLSATALQLAGDTAILPRIGSGEVIVALAYAEPGSPWDGGFTTRADNGQLTGSKTLVVDGHVADILLVTAVTPDGLALYAVNGSATTRRPLPTLDQTRSLAEVSFDSTPATLVSADGARVLRQTLETAAVLLAAEQLGGAQRCLDMAVDYAKIRTQFGRAIGSFQAIKHRCADMLLDVETARSAVMLAMGEESAETASLARAHCSEVFSRTATSNVQIHGGIGFTWEHDAHLYLKRAKSSELLLGSPNEHRELVAQAIGL
jgi:alkylation response protein AidB-like acyl-CoA dehydrogenase